MEHTHGRWYADSLPRKNLFCFVLFLGQLPALYTLRVQVRSARRAAPPSRTRPRAPRPAPRGRAVPLRAPKP